MLTNFGVLFEADSQHGLLERTLGKLIRRVLGPCVQDSRSETIHIQKLACVTVVKYRERERFIAGDISVHK